MSDLVPIDHHWSGVPQPDRSPQNDGLARIWPLSYVGLMTQAVARILGDVEQLSEPERQQFRRAIVERVPMSEDLTDEDFAALAAESFRALDEEEDAPRA